MFKSLLFHFSQFTELAFNLLDTCYRSNEKETLKLITGQSQQFNNRTCLDLAVGTNDLEFVSHSCVQALLNDVWTGSIKNLDITTRDFLLTIFFPPYLLTFDFRTESEMKDMIHMADEAPMSVPMASMGLALPIPVTDHKDNDEMELHEKEEQFQK